MLNATQALVTELALRGKAAARAMALRPTAQKDAALRALSARLRADAAPEVLAANADDMAAAEAAGLSLAALDRLRLDPARLEAIARGVDAVAALPDPVGAILGRRSLPNGLSVARMRIPLGLIAIVYESRPNVTIDAAALCVKSGNAVVLRGGSEARRTNDALARVARAALENEGLPVDAVTLLPTQDRAATLALLGLSGIVDLVIPRGGESLIRFVTEHARVPVIQHFKGICHVYVDRAAAIDGAVQIVVNAKTQRPGVCNAMETLLVDRGAPDGHLPALLEALRDRGVELRGDEAVRARCPWVLAATAHDFDTEHLGLIASVALVDGLDGALAHVAAHGTRHTEAIVTEDRERAARWLREVDASLVLANASTRFNDGGELGLGAEMGISTTKLHAYGPMGLEELCSLKWIAEGTGQIRA